MMLPIFAGNAEDRDFLENKIVEFNQLKIPFTQEENFIHLDYVIKDEDITVGGITATVYCWKCLYVNVLWINEQYRNQGLGIKLLSKVEEEAKKLGCHLSHLDTFDFQAKDFYLKNGYTIFGVLNDCPIGHSRFYLSKKL